MIKNKYYSGFQGCIEYFFFCFYSSKRDKKLQLYFNGPRAAENRLMYLVSATLGSYSSTDCLHFVANEKNTI